MAWLGFFLAVVLLELTMSPVSADNCSVFTDCFGQSEAASEAALGLTFLAALSLVIDFIPIVGDVKGLIELGTGKDLLTGQELEPWERSLGLIGLIPGGDLLRLAKLGDAAGGLASGARAADGFGDVGSGAGGLGRLDAASTGRPGASAPVTATGRGDAFDPFDLQSGAGSRPVSPDSPLPALRPGGQQPTPGRPPGDPGGRPGRGADPDAEAPRQTGAGTSFEGADEAYDAIRQSTTDVDAIAANSGFSRTEIADIKDHVFNKEQYLDRYEDLGIPGEWRRFDSDPAIADAWTRLENGVQTPDDIQLLNHELTELRYMRETGNPSYNAAHNYAESIYPAPEYGSGQ